MMLNEEINEPINLLFFKRKKLKQMPRILMVIFDRTSFLI